MPETKPSLQLELQELLLVGVGAVPGACCAGSWLCIWGIRTCW